MQDDIYSIIQKKKHELATNVSYNETTMSIGLMCLYFAVDKVKVTSSASDFVIQYIYIYI